MKNFLLIILLLFVISSIITAQGTLTTISFFSKSLGTTRDVQIYLPQDYNLNDSIRYPVFYFLHGATENHTAWPELAGILDTLIENKYISPVIVVKPDGSIGPWAGSMYTNSELYGNFEDYIVYDLVEYVDLNFKTIPSRDKRAIWGGSMGGYGSMKLALKHPDIYCAVASHSAPLDFSHFVSWCPMILNENGGAPVDEYIPTPYTYTWLFYTAAGAFSPNLNNPPYYVDFPLDTMGNFIDSVFNRWQLQNPVKLAANLPQNTGLAIYFDCGMEDEFLFYPFNTGFADSLEVMNIDYVFGSFSGTHTNKFLNRVPIALRFIDSVMNQVTVVFSHNNTVSQYHLSQNYPNPFNPTTKINYSVPNRSLVTIKIFDVLGKEVQAIINEEKSAGIYEITWNAVMLPSGVYFYQLKAGSFIQTKKMILLR